MNAKQKQRSSGKILITKYKSYLVNKLQANIEVILMVMQKETVDNTIRKVRNARKITQEELAQAVGVSRQTIISIEKGNYIPSVLLALKISAFFSVTVESLFTITESL